MTSYALRTRFADAPDDWSGNNSLRYATREEAQAHLDDIRRRRPDLIETKIVECPSKATHAWINGDCQGRGQMAHGDLRAKGYGWRK
jgi:hypothetical protein